MPTYVYRKDDGSHVALTMRIAELERRQGKDGAIVLDDGSTARRDFGAEGGYHNPGRGWPVRSLSMACHPDQVERYRELAKERGVPTEITRDGRPVLTNESHARRFRQAFGYFQRNSYYG